MVTINTLIKALLIGDVPRGWYRTHLGAVYDADVPRARDGAVPRSMTLRHATALPTVAPMAGRDRNLCSAFPASLRHRAIPLARYLLRHTLMPPGA